MTVPVILPSGAKLDLDLDAAVQDLAARTLFGHVVRLRPGPAGGELLAYIALWRPRVNALRWSRALAIAEEVLALMETEGRDRVTRALSAAVDALQPRAQQPDWTPLSNHRYLLSCLASTSAQALAVAPAARGETWNATPSATPSATLTGLAGLEALR